MQQLTFGSLFAGIGGFDLGFERAGMKCKWQVEIDDYATKVLEKHWPHVHRERDIRECGAHNLEWVDVICGGDPCQANSAAGKSSRESFGGEFIRIIDELRPTIVVRENPSHIRRDAPWPWWKFRGGLESVGYAVLPFRLRACCLGAQHRRERLFLLAEYADSYRNRLEGRARPTFKLQAIQPSRLVEKDNWTEVCASGGFDSRAGLPAYVDEVRGLGNAVVPQVAEWIGNQIVSSLNRS